MKPLTPHDSLDDLIVAALHGELTPEERTQLDSRLKTDAAARAAYQEAQLMHDLLEKTYNEAQPDPAFEQRMISGVRRKIHEEEDRPAETALGSLIAVWAILKMILGGLRTRWVPVFTVLFIMVVLAGVAFGPITNGIKQAKGNAAMQEARQAALERQAQGQDDLAEAAKSDRDDKTVDAGKSGPSTVTTDRFADEVVASKTKVQNGYIEPTVTTTPQGGTVRGTGFDPGMTYAQNNQPTSADSPMPTSSPAPVTQTTTTLLARNKELIPNSIDQLRAPTTPMPTHSIYRALDKAKRAGEGDADAPDKAPTVIAKSGEQTTTETIRVFADNETDGTPAPKTDEKTRNTSFVKAGDQATADAGRKLIRNAELELEVKSFQAAMDQIGALTKDAGGYVDTSNSERGGNGKLQGNVVVKVLPQNLDAFLLKLRDLGELRNQMLKTDDVTKAYVDTQARIANSQAMETQLQELLKHDTNKVSELLEVERELARVRGEIEQMQGEIKVYDFQVAYATVTMHLSESDLNQTAAYLLKEQDEFALFATDVEGTFQQARHTADDFKATILVANLQHNSGSDVSAQLQVTVPPDQIEAFLGQVKQLGRVANFTRQTQRTAKDGGDSNQAADQTLTEKDRVVVNITIRSDDESRKQVSLTVVTPAVDKALDQAKAAALANAGTEILGSAIKKDPQGQSSAHLVVRVPGKEYDALMESFRALGRTAAFTLQRDDNSGPGANGDEAPVIVSLSLTDNDTPLQETDLSVRATDVDNQAQQLKKDAATAGVEITASSFQRQPDGSEQAQMTFRLPMSKYTGFLETLKKLGKVEGLTVNRQDRPDQTRDDDTAPAEIRLVLHNERDLVTEDNGLWATLRKTFGEGTSALFTSVQTIGVIVAFLVPWVFALGLLAWIGRRIYIWKRK